MKFLKVDVSLLDSPVLSFVLGAEKVVYRLQSGMNSHLTGNPDLEPSVPEQGKRKQRNKRTPKNGAEKPPSRWKKRKKDDEERQAVYTNTDTLMTQLKQVNTHYYITKNI